MLSSQRSVCSCLEELFLKELFVSFAPLVIALFPANLNAHGTLYATSLGPILFFWKPIGATEFLMACSVLGEDEAWVHADHRKQTIVSCPEACSAYTWW